MRVISLLLVHAWTPSLLSVIINTPYEAIRSNSYGKYQYFTDEKNSMIGNSGSTTIQNKSSGDDRGDYNLSDITHNSSSSNSQNDYISNDINHTSSSSNDHNSEYGSKDISATSSSDHQSDYDSNNIVKDADLTLFINLDDNLYEDDADNETTSVESVTSKLNETAETSGSNNFNSLKRNESSLSKPAIDDLNESTRSEITSQKYQITYVPVKYYPTSSTVPVPTKTFDLSINSETSFNKLFLSRFQLQFSRAPPNDKAINNNNNNGNINYYNSYFANNHFKVPSLWRVPAIVADRIKKKGAAFLGGLAGFYNA